MTDISQIIEDRISGLRPKLLDLGRRNPLISTTFSERSHSLVRVVDELPDFLYGMLSSKQKMEFAPLPPLDVDPKDEDTREFQSIVADSRLTDQIYIDALDLGEGDFSGSAERLAKAERDLKDRIREQLGMRSRQTKLNLSIKQHAINNNISASYELPLQENQNEDGRHDDNLIQTLLLPDALVRRSSNVMTKYRTWIQETGINVLHIVFGFLEWHDDHSDKSSFAPLILISVDIEKKRTAEGYIFSIKSIGDSAEKNEVLAEKLQIEFGIELPVLDENDTPELYFSKVVKTLPPGKNWKVRRQVAIGVFPSARIAMYHDLAPSNWNFSENPIVSDLIGGSEDFSGGSFYGDEYDVDDPEIESKVPIIVADIDSSQFSAIVDVSNGKNLAVEGPPGSGKSQTIVNTIAAAMASGKKVLFVAEKTAALDVVRSRFEAWGLGEFILPLLANRSSRLKVIDSIRNRINITPKNDPSELDWKIANLKTTRAKIKEYLDVLSQSLGITSLTVYDIFGKYISNHYLLKRLPSELTNKQHPNIRNLTPSKFNLIIDICEQLDTARKETFSRNTFWENISVTNITPFQINEILYETEKCVDALEETIIARHGLKKYELDTETPNISLTKLQEVYKAIAESVKEAKLNLLPNLCTINRIESLRSFLSKADAAKEENDRLLLVLKEGFSRDTANDLRELANILSFTKPANLSRDNIKKFLISKKRQISETEESIGILRDFIKDNKFLKSITLSNIIKVSDLIFETTKSIITGRRNDFAEPTVKKLFRRYKIEAESLVERKVVLQQLFTINAIDDISRANECTEVISNAGFFSYFSGRYRKAKVFYRYISKHDKYKKSTAASELKALTEWLIDNDNFNSDKRLQEMLGISYDGIDTDFDSIIKVFDFFDTVDNDFPGIVNKPLRHFLKHSDHEKVFSFPIIENNHPLRSIKVETFTEAQNRIYSLKTAFETHMKNVKRILELSPMFRSYNSTVLEKLYTYADIIDSFFGKVDLLQKDKEIEGLLGQLFNGYKTKSDQFKHTLLVADELVKLDADLNAGFLSTILENKLEGIMVVIDSVTLVEEKFSSLLNNLKVLTGLDLSEYRDSINQTDFIESLKVASNDKEGLSAYSGLYTIIEQLDATEFSFLSKYVEFSQENNILFSDLFKAFVYHAMASEVYLDHAEILKQYNGATLDTLRERFSDLDKDIIKLNRERLAAKLLKISNPPPGVGRGLKRDYTEMSLIRNEISKKRRFISSRSLTQRSGKALLELKPCWMMSPLAVAQYIPKGSIEFDLVVIDEASQMTPENSIGALVRSKQAMVVGDTNQLPPTTFFRKVFDDYENEDEEAVTNESILEMANAVFRPARRLRWHYRSRHTSLIAFSNKYVYNNDLIIFPSAHHNSNRMGVSLNKVDGLYSSGTNPVEAKVMADEIVAFMKKFPDRSLGVVVVNQRQRDLLAQEFEYASNSEPKCIKYIDRWENDINEGLESFFIKNLENVQGDERDVMFIGTVYGPEKPGAKVMQRFGPINGIAGKRRLNVLFTRAKEKIVTFSSMTSADIYAQEGGNEGAFLLKKWLEYSGSGFLETGDDTGRPPDSDFELYVIESLKAIGCEPVPQVGVAGYFIDIGVKHSKWPHGYILGVECDGRAYHSSKSARDRDRLRQEVLEGLGWQLHRIWSTDWFEDPLREIDRLRDVVTKRLSHLTENNSYDDIEIDVSSNQESKAKYRYEDPPETEFNESDIDHTEVASEQEDDINEYVEVGDSVMFYYDEDIDDVKEITISSRTNDPDNHVILYSKPLAQALIEAEIDEQAILSLNNVTRTVTVVGIKKKDGKTIGAFTGALG